MPRWPKRVEEPLAPVTNDQSVVAEPVNVKTEKQTVKTKFVPFNGDTKKLEAPIYDKKGRISKPGAPKYYLNMTRTGFDLIKIYRNGKGVSRRLVFPYKTILDTQKCRKNRVAVESLKKSGLPVYN